MLPPWASALQGKKIYGVCTYDNRLYLPGMPSCAACGRRNNLISGRQRPLNAPLTPHPARQGPSRRFAVGVDIYSALLSLKCTLHALGGPRFGRVALAHTFATLAIWCSTPSGGTNHVCDTNYGLGRCIYAVVGHAQCHRSQRSLRSVFGRRGGVARRNTV